MIDESLLRRLPKAELHCHLEGAVPAETAIMLARRNGVRLPTYDAQQLYRFADLPQFLTVYRAVCASIVTAADFAEVAYAAQADAAIAANLRYRELFVNPTNHPDLPYPRLLAGVLDGLRAAQVDHGVIGRLIPAINREQSASVAGDLVEAVIAHRVDEVVGIGLDHNDVLGPPVKFAGVYARARAAGLRRTAHAGEIAQARQVTESIEVLGCERIDHGYAIIDDPVALAHALASGVHFATCWSTCAWFHPDRIGVASPIVAMAAAGLPLSINSDDPPMFGTDIGREYHGAATAFGWTLDDAQRAALTVLDAAWIDDTERRQLVDEFRRETTDLGASTAELDIAE
ncbi:adenosine deaminase [Nocardia sp. NPDC052001]|uniref:adenosine deaminase n=1 Tax=Nocardia sp. NPDC052001 TaxID=3154853 RepID=UPI00342552A1